MTTAVFVALGWTAFGHGYDGARADRVHASKQWVGSKFENAQPMFIDNLGAGMALFEKSPVVAPAPGYAFPVVKGADFSTPPASGLRITWFGHSTTVIEVDGAKFLTDPVWSERASPYSFVGPKRWFAPLIAIPRVNAVLISHDHYDHLDEGTVRQLKGSKFIVPLGVGAHLEYWGIPASDITELDWWQETTVAGVRVVSTPSRHASGRHPLDQMHTLWTSYAVVGPAHRVFYSGDTGLTPAFNEVGEKLGPFDVAMIEIGQYHQAWRDWHIGPEQAVRAAGMVRGKVMFPIHWALFELALHGWTEPIERVSVEAAAKGMPLTTPKPGESVEPAVSLPHERWWPELAWQKASEHPIVSTKVDP